MIKFFRRLLTAKRVNFDPTPKPLSNIFGFDRGTPIDRFFIERFIYDNSNDIRGQVLEVAEGLYSKKFGRANEISILLYESRNQQNSICGDLTNMATLPQNFADCFICTQTLNFIFDFKAAIKGIHHVLKPGGTALITVAGLTQISRYDMDRWGDFWRFTDLSLKKCFAEVFPETQLEVSSYGNLYAAIALLKGMATEEVCEKELLKKDPDYQIVITAKAIK